MPIGLSIAIIVSLVGGSAYSLYKTRDGACELPAEVAPESEWRRESRPQFGGPPLTGTSFRSRAGVYPAKERVHVRK